MFWVKAVTVDGTTYIGIVTDLNARLVHRWLYINTNQPDSVMIHNITVVAIPAGDYSVESTWGTGNLILHRFYQDDVYTWTVNLDINSAVPFMVDRWVSGCPQLIFFPGINRYRYPPALRVRLPATLTQVGLIRTNEQDGGNNNAYREDNNNRGAGDR